jgi:ABC-type antimicrobial peptide transport system permease subunit
MNRIDPDMAVWDSKTMTEHVNGSTFPTRMATSLVAVFGALALVLALVGVHGVMAYSVSQSSREFGIRMALGARSKEILELVLLGGVKTILLGIGVGLVLAFNVTRLLTSLLYGVNPFDWTTFAVVSAILMGGALAACIMPARRAARVEPNTALRCE